MTQCISVSGYKCGQCGDALLSSSFKIQFPAQLQKEWLTDSLQCYASSSGTAIFEPESCYSQASPWPVTKKDNGMRC